jgi:hypothetical protein
MRIHQAVAVAALIVVGASQSCLADDNNNRWYDSSPEEVGKKGFYGYEVKPPEPEKKDEQPAQQKAVPPQVAGPMKWPTYEEAMKMKPSALGDIIKKAAEEAIGDPSNQESVIRWATYMKAMTDKGGQFAESVAWALLQNPQLSYQEYTNVVPGGRAMVRARAEEMHGYLAAKADDHALVLFERPGHALNPPLEDIIRRFCKETGWEMRVVNIEESRRLAEIVGVSMTPQVFVITKDNRNRPFVAATSSTSLTALKEAVYRGLRVTEDGVPTTEFATWGVKGAESFGGKDKGGRK